MKKITTVWFLVLGITLLSGCSLNQEKLENPPKTMETKNTANQQEPEKTPKLIRINWSSYYEVNDEIKDKPTCGTADFGATKVIKDAKELTEDGTTNFEFKSNEELGDGVWIQRYWTDTTGKCPKKMIIARYNNNYHLFKEKIQDENYCINLPCLEKKSQCNYCSRTTGKDNFNCSKNHCENEKFECIKYK